MGWFSRSAHPEDQLSAYIDGELDTRQAENVARHLASCVECAAVLEAHGFRPGERPHDLWGRA